MSFHAYDITIPTDSSGQWVSSRDIPTILESVVRQCMQIAQTQGNTTAAEIMQQRFNIDPKEPL